MPGRISSLNASEKKFIDDAIAASERAKGKSLNGTERKSVLSRAREQIISQRKAESAKKEREAERHANEFTWNKPKTFKKITSPLGAEANLFAPRKRNFITPFNVSAYAHYLKTTSLLFFFSLMKACAVRAV